MWSDAEREDGMWSDAEWVTDILKRSRRPLLSFFLSSFFPSSRNNLFSQPPRFSTNIISLPPPFKPLTLPEKDSPRAAGQSH